MRGHFTINMISLVEMPDFLIPRDGHYLVQTESEYGPNGVFKSIHQFSTRVTKHQNQKTGKWHNSYGCNGNVTHISDTPLRYELTDEEKKEKIKSSLNK